MVSGSQARRLARQSNTNTERRRGSTGRAMPASAATSPDHGPAASTIVPASIWPPERSVTALRRQSHDLVGDVLDAPLARLAAEGLHQRRTVEPALVGGAMRGQRHAVGRYPGKARAQRRRIEQLDGAALALLDGVVGAQHRLAGRDLPGRDSPAPSARDRRPGAPDARRRKPMP